MDRYLGDKQIEYVLYHLNFNFKLNAKIRDRVVYIHEDFIQGLPQGKIIFKLSEQPLQDEKIVWIDEIPLLFPIGSSKKFFSWEKGSIVFHHDILKSIFYLLSGYQETQPVERDKNNRFPYEGSVQQRLGIVNKPIVNYYFEIIEEGIKELCKREEIPFPRQRLFDNLGLMLSHDVDVIDTYTIRDLIYKLKQVFNLVPRTSFQQSIRYFWKYLLNYFKLFNRPNPHWDFDYLIATAKTFGFRSVFYFLHKDLKHIDSYYSFEDERIQQLFSNLSDENCEIGLHGSSRSSENIDVLKNHYTKLRKYSGQKITGIRQHRLIHIHPTTAQIQAECGLLYDATLGFAEHEGFRNSTCLPFKLYDFQKDEMMEIWEFPLVLMDATLFMYRKLNPEESLKSVKQLTDEIKKFGGIFSLLWHNGNFDEENYPDGKILFEQILSHLKYLDCESVTGEDCIKNHVNPIFEVEII